MWEWLRELPSPPSYHADFNRSGLMYATFRKRGLWNDTAGFEFSLLFLCTVLK